jgi:hypothetical protein
MKINHYDIFGNGSYEAVDIMKNRDLFKLLGFYENNIIKYQSRLGKKEPFEEDLTKIKDYQSRLEKFNELYEGELVDRAIKELEIEIDRLKEIRKNKLKPIDKAVEFAEYICKNVLCKEAKEPSIEFKVRTFINALAKEYYDDKEEFDMIKQGKRKIFSKNNIVKEELFYYIEIYTPTNYYFLNLDFDNNVIINDFKNAKYHFDFTNPDMKTFDKILEECE